MTSRLLCGQQSPNFIQVEQPFFASEGFYEDANGFMVTTNNIGLYKYDGYDFHFEPFSQLFGSSFTQDRNFKLFKDRQGDLWISSLKGELSKVEKIGQITSYKEQLSSQGDSPQINVWKSHEENIWLGANNGSLYKYSYLTNKILRVNVLPEVLAGSQGVLSIAALNKDELWVSTFAGFLYSYSISKNEFQLIEDSMFPPNQNLRLLNDLNGRIWIAKEKKGLFLYDSENTVLQSVKLNGSNRSSRDRFMIISLFCDQSGDIWVGTDGDGLYRIDTQTKVVQEYVQDDSNPFSIGSNTIVDIGEDSNGNIWCTLKSGMVNVLPKENPDIQYYNGLKSNKPTKVNAVYKTRDDILWIGTDGEGLLKIAADGKKTAFTIAEEGKRYFDGRYIQQLQEDANGNLWIGTYQHGLWIVDAKSKKIRKKELDTLNVDLNSDIRCLLYTSPSPRDS